MMFDKINRPQRILIAVIVTLSVGALLYYTLSGSRLGASAILYIGIPTMMSITLIVVSRPKSATGIILKMLVLALLVAWIILPEGAVCIVMLSPLFLGVGAIVGLVYDKFWGKKKQQTTLKAAMLVLPLLMMVEGTAPLMTFERGHVVSAEKILSLTPDQIATAIQQPLSFDQPVPPMLRMGFPLPVSAEMDTFTVGGTQHIQFDQGAMTLVVTERSDAHIAWAFSADTTPIADWLTWRTATVEWEVIDDTHTLVRWSIAYDRELDPAWYFGTLEAIGVTQAANFLINITFPTEN